MIAEPVLGRFSLGFIHFGEEGVSGRTTFGGLLGIAGVNLGLPGGCLIQSYYKKCGKDVSLVLQNLLNKVQSDYNAMNFVKQIVACVDLATPGGWDIKNRFSIGHSLNCPSGGCLETAELMGKCYAAGDINYMLFGTMAKICNYSWNEMRGLITTWKFLRNWNLDGNLDISLDFATVAYKYAGTNGNAVYDGNLPPPNRPDCTPGCGVRTDPLDYFWEPWKTRVGNE